MLTSERLELRRVHQLDVEALHIGPDALSARLGVRVPKGWPTFPEAFTVEPGVGHHGRDPDTPWPSLFFIDRGAGVLVGNGGFTGPPDREGSVEFGYEIAEPFRNRGYATEATMLMVGHAFADPVVERVVAHTLAEENASTRVLHRAGLRRVGEFEDPETGMIWRWELLRAAWVRP